MIEQGEFIITVLVGNTAARADVYIGKKSACPIFAHPDALLPCYTGDPDYKAREIGISGQPKKN